MKKIREVITVREHKQLNAFVVADEKMRDATKENLHKTFLLLYLSGCRITEILGIRNQNILEIIEHGETIINIEKQDKERKLIFTDAGIKAIKKLFTSYNIYNEDAEAFVIRSKGVKHISPDKSTYTKQINTVIHACLGSRFSSHSYRSGVITQLAIEAKVSIALIRDYIGHKNSATTLSYVKSDTTSIRSALVR